MAASQNGYSANDRSQVASYEIPGGKIALRKGDVSVVLLYVAHRFHNEVEKLVWPGNWGYAERAIRGSTVTSNHASGTAIDLNAPRHPLGKVNTFNVAQRNAIRNILNFCEGVVRWGGDYSGRKDDMHFEINAGAAAVARIANKIRGNGGGSAPVATPDMRWIQDRLNHWGFRVAVDGKAGPQTTAAIKAFQASKRLGVDGVVGPKTREALSASRLAHPVIGSIAATYNKPNYANILGAPRGPEVPTKDPRGRWQEFERGGIYWHPLVDNGIAHAVSGAIWQRWTVIGRELTTGFPSTDELQTPDRLGRFNHFWNGWSIYWHPRTGAWPLHGLFRHYYGTKGWERGPLGYPTSGEYIDAKSKLITQNFQHGKLILKNDVPIVIAL